MHEDIGTLYKLLDKSKRICHINRAGYHYVQRNNSSSHSDYAEEKLVVVEFVKEIMKFIEEKYPNILEESEVIFIEYLNNNIIFCRKNKYVSNYNKLLEKLKEFLPRVLKNSKMKFNIKIKCFLIAYLGGSLYYKK